MPILDGPKAKKYNRYDRQRPQSPTVGLGLYGLATIAGRIGLVVVDKLVRKTAIGLGQPEFKQFLLQKKRIVFRLFDPKVYQNNTVVAMHHQVTTLFAVVQPYQVLLHAQPRNRPL